MRTHRSPRISGTFLLSALLCAVSIPCADAAPPARAGEARGVDAPSFTATRVDPMLYMWRDTLRVLGPDAPLFALHGAPDPQHVGVVLRLTRRPDRALMARAEAIGLRFLRHGKDGLPWGLGEVYRAQIDWDHLEELERLDTLRFAEAAWAPGVTAPTRVTGEMIGTFQANRRPDVGVTGKGVKIADIDAGLDVLHPSFFHPDGGRYDWIDVDMDGQFSPMVDAVGIVERLRYQVVPLRVLDGVQLSYDWSQGQYVFDGRDGALDPRRDWLYLDLNGNGKRDSGPANFSETTLAYGEPIFVVDDVDGSGTLDPGEGLMRLGSSKVSAVGYGATIWRRGIDLIEAMRNDTQGDTSHGTGVAGILIGGQYGYHDEVGLAPDAELVSFNAYDGQSNWIFDDNAQLAALENAVIEEADLVLHEWTNPFTRPHDGSGNLEAAMDAASAMGLTQVNPLGNLNKARKHLDATLTPLTPLTSTFTIGDGYDYNGQLYPYTYLYGSIQWEGAQPLTLAITSPSGTTRTLDLSVTQPQQLGQDWVQIGHMITSRGNSMVILTLSSSNQRRSLLKGAWTIALSGATAPTQVQQRITDYYSTWGVGVGWGDAVSNHATLTFPATADSALGVAAHAGRFSDFPTGRELRSYSGRGPRLGGDRAVDITAPDDPFAPMGLTQEYINGGYERGWFSVFGGTSGAGPHVAAAVALLLEQDPARTPEQITDRLMETASRDGLPQELPDTQWGAGRLDVYRALYDEAPSSDVIAPSAALVVTQQGATARFDATVSQDAEGGALQARFDLENDGEWDNEWGESLELSRAVSELAVGEPQVARVQVRDTAGNSTGALAAYTLDEPPVEPPDMGMASEEMGGEEMGMMPADMGATSEEMGSSPSAPDMGASEDEDVDVIVLPESPEVRDEGCTVASPTRHRSPLSLWLLALGAMWGGRRVRRRRS